MKSFHTKFEIQADHCYLQVGDTLIPDTVMGLDPETGATLYADCYGKVTSIDITPHEPTVQIHAKIWELPDEPALRYDKTAIQKNRAKSKGDFHTMGL